MADEFEPYDVAIPYPALAERFEEWVRSQGWMLSDIVYPDNDNRPMRFVQPGHGVPPVPKQEDRVSEMKSGNWPDPA